jgi:hypothetical protein
MRCDVAVVAKVMVAAATVVKLKRILRLCCVVCGLFGSRVAFESFFAVESCNDDIC